MTLTMEKKHVAQHLSTCAHHYEMAAKHCQEAAKHHEAGEHEKGCCSAMLAHGHACCADHHAKEAAKCCAGVEGK